MPREPKKMFDDTGNKSANEPDGRRVVRPGRRRARWLVVAVSSASAVLAAAALLAVMLANASQVPEIVEEVPMSGTRKSPATQDWQRLAAGNLSIAVPPDWDLNVVEPHRPEVIQGGPCAYDLYGGVEGLSGKGMPRPRAVVYPSETTGVCRAIRLPDRAPQRPSLVIYAGAPGRYDELDLRRIGVQARIGDVEARRIQHEHYVEFVLTDHPGGLWVSHPEDPVVQRILETAELVDDAGSGQTPRGNASGGDNSESP